jgi:hypothetical protein
MQKEITEEKLQERYEACVAGVQKVKAVLDEVNPDVLVIVGDDQHEQFLDDNMPIFAIYHGDEMFTVQRRAPWADNGQRPEDSRPVIKGEPDLAMHLIRELCGEGFDIARTNKQREGVGLGHAFINPYMRYLPDRDMPIVPFMVNTYFPPNTPTPRRCYALGQGLRNAIESWKSDKRVCLVASGGLSHSIIDEELDHQVLDALVEKDADTLRALPMEKLIRGTSEIRNWILVAGAMEPMQMTIVDYVPYYRSEAGTGCGGGFTYWT